MVSFLLVRAGITSRMRGFLAVAGAACLVLAGSATAGRVGWNEAAKVGGVKVMTYTVDSLTFGAKSWSAHISFSNVSHATIGVRSEFGVAFYADARTTTLSRMVGFAPATTFSTKLPTSLKPGGSWRGTIGGAGRLTSNQRVYARVVFGPFSGVPGQSASIVWITDHAKAFGKGPSQGQIPNAGPVI